jgi:hypothetical protein
VQTERNKTLLALGVLILAALTLPAISQVHGNGSKPPFRIPRTWNDQDVQSLEVPLADQSASTEHVSAQYYYQIPVRPIYQSYPVYHPQKEPQGYLERLKTLAPEVIFDSSKLKTEGDWIRAGEIVFDAPIEFESSGTLFEEVRDAAWYETNRVPTTRDGILPFMRYVIREKGKVELGILSCAMCHSRVLPDGNVIRGAQGNFPDDRAFGYETRLEASRAANKDKSQLELPASCEETTLHPGCIPTQTREQTRCLWMRSCPHLRQSCRECAPGKDRASFIRLTFLT